jgi:putative DNA primase/helicase
VSHFGDFCRAAVSSAVYAHFPDRETWLPYGYVAEIGSLMLGEQLGIGHDPSQHVAYVASWIKTLEEDPREVFRAAVDAEKIVKLVRSYELGQEQTSDNTQDAGSQQEEAMPSPSGPAARLPTMIRNTSPAAQAPSSERTYLAVPYAEKDDAKQLGAKWDRAEKAWYVPAGMDLESFTPWMPAKGSVHIAVEADPVEQFAEALRESGLLLDGAPQMDGQLHRVRAQGDHGAQRSGAYQGHLDGRPAGFFQNHRTGVKQNWKATGQAAALDTRDRAQLAAEAAQKRQERAREREQQAERVAQQVDVMWAAATPVEAHPYLADKGVQSYGLRQDEAGRLLVPVQDADGRLWSVQKIGPAGFKQFQEGGRVEGGHFAIGDVREPGPVLIAEGYATAATLHEITGMPAIVAFNAGNLLPVAQTYRAIDPDRTIYIAGDDDWQRSTELDTQGRPKVNVGRVKAEEAAAAIGGQAVFPEFATGSDGTDWNDLAQTRGRPFAADVLRQSIAVADREQAVRVLGASRKETIQNPSQVFDHAVDWTQKPSHRERTLVQAVDQGHER